jgi:hypothetical protein
MSIAVRVWLEDRLQQLVLRRAPGFDDLAPTMVLEQEKNQETVWVSVDGEKRLLLAVSFAGGNERDGFIRLYRPGTEPLATRLAAGPLGYSSDDGFCAQSTNGWTFYPAF